MQKQILSLRRSTRLQSSGYYDSQGSPTVSYYETKPRHIKRRRRRTRRDYDIYDVDDIMSYTEGPMFKLVWVPFILFVLCIVLGCFSLWYRATHDLPKTSRRQHQDFISIEILKVRVLQNEIQALKKLMTYLIDDKPNLALESIGTTVVYGHTSEPYKSPNLLPSDKLPVSPVLILQGFIPNLSGRCWAFPGGHGDLVIRFPLSISISQVTLGHISKNMSPTGNISSAPKNFSIYGMESLDGEGSSLGSFVFDQDGDLMQTFKLPDDKKGVFRFVKLQIESNWGNPDYTCLYSFRVHGTMRRPQRR